MNEKDLDRMIRRIFSEDFANLPEEERYNRILEFLRAIDGNNVKVMVGNNSTNMTSLLNMIKIMGPETVARLLAERIATLAPTVSTLHGPEDIRKMRERVKNGTGTEEDETICKMLDEMKDNSDDKDDEPKTGRLNDMPSFLHGLSFIMLNYIKNSMLKDNVKNISAFSLVTITLLLLAANNLAHDGYYASNGSQYKGIEDSGNDLGTALTDSKEKAENVVRALAEDKDLLERLGLKGLPDDALTLIALSVAIICCETSCMSSTNISDIMDVLSIEDVCHKINEYELNKKESKKSPPKFDGSMFSKGKFKEMTNDEGKSFLMDD